MNLGVKGARKDTVMGDSPARGIRGGVLDDSEENDKERFRDRHKHRSKHKKKSRGDVKDHRTKDKDRSKTSDGVKEKEKEVKDSDKESISSTEKRRDEKEDHDKDRTKDRVREKVHYRDKQRGKDHDSDRDEKDRARKRGRERERDNELESDKGRDKENAKDKSKDKQREKEYSDRERDKWVDNNKERSKDKEKTSRRSWEDYEYRKDGEKDVKTREVIDYNRNIDISESGKTSSLVVDDTALIKHGDYVVDSSVVPGQSQRVLEEQILKMKEERLKRKSEGASEILSWVNKSRKLEEKSISEKEKALQRSKLFEEQDTIDEYEDEDDIATKEATNALAGVKVLHGIDKELEGGSVVLTLKDQEILADGDLNGDMDMLENVEMGVQKRRQEAYKASKNIAAIYDDKFNDQPGEKMLPQYDDPAEEEGVTLDIAGWFSSESQKKLEELRRRLEAPSRTSQIEDLKSSLKISSD